MKNGRTIKICIFVIFSLILLSQSGYADTPSVTNVKFDKTYYYPGDQLVVGYDIQCSHCRVTTSIFFIKDIGTFSGSGSDNLGVGGGSKIFSTKLPENIGEGTLDYIIDVEWHDRHPDYINFPVEYDKQLDALKSGSITIKKKPVVTQAPTTAPPTPRPTTTLPPKTTSSPTRSDSSFQDIWNRFWIYHWNDVIIVLIFVIAIVVVLRRRKKRPQKVLSPLKPTLKTPKTPSKGAVAQKCPNCGNQIRGTDKFCRKCGNKI